MFEVVTLSQETSRGIASGFTVEMSIDLQIGTEEEGG
jgi:hypothetical protein